MQGSTIVLFAGKHTQMKILHFSCLLSSFQEKVFFIGLIVDGLLLPFEGWRPVTVVKKGLKEIQALNMQT